MIIGKYVGRYHGVRIFETRRLGSGIGGGGLALPGWGIYVATGSFSKEQDMMTVRHEFGHILQSRLTGWLTFYLFIGLPSLMSAWLKWHGKGHQHYWTEKWCNHLAKEYFADIDWPERRFPCSDLNHRSKKWLTNIV